MADFAPLFDRWATAVRRRLAWRQALLGSATGLAASACAAGLAWSLGSGTERRYAVLLPFIGLVAGWAWARRTRWSDGEVALYLDGRLDTREVVSTALGLRGEVSPEASADVIQRAAHVLDRPIVPKALPRVLTRWLLLTPLAALGFIAATLAPTRAVPTAALEPGTDRVQRANVTGLETIEKLRTVDATDPKLRADLLRAAETTRALREALKQGIERREALSRLAEIRDDIRSARLQGKDARERAQEDVSSAMRRMAALQDVADSLRAGDLVEMDRRMHELANRAEATSREAALEALEAARQAAARGGATEMSEMFRRQKELFEQRSRDAELLRQLAEALGESLPKDAKDALERMQNSGDPEAQAALAEALAKALGALTEEQRKQLAQALSDQASETGEGRAMTSEELRQLAERLATPEGRQRLEETLRRLATAQPSPEAEREQALGDAEQGLDDAARDIAGIPVPTPGERGAGNAPPGPGGSKRDEGTGNHDGQSAPVAGDSLRAKARTELDRTAPSRAASLGRIAPTPGSGAPAQPAPADLEAQAPSELQAVERSDLPEAYREQVRRYFTP